jgi:hypothetical protein
MARHADQLAGRPGENKVQECHDAYLDYDQRLAASALAQSPVLSPQRATGAGTSALQAPWQVLGFKVPLKIDVVHGFTCASWHSGPTTGHRLASGPGAHSVVALALETRHTTGGG